MNSPHHPHHEHHDVHQQRLLWFFSFCNQRSSSSSSSSSSGNNGSARRGSPRRKSASSRNKFAIQYQQQLLQQQRQTSNVFGCDLTEHTHSFSDGDAIPHIVKSCTRFIEKHGIIFGIYRLSGMRINIHKLRQDFDKNPKTSMIDSEAISSDAHAVACVLKQYFRELPIPLLTFHMYERFIQLFKHNNTNSNNINNKTNNSANNNNDEDDSYDCENVADINKSQGKEEDSNSFKHDKMNSSCGNAINTITTTTTTIKTTSTPITTAAKSSTKQKSNAAIATPKCIESTQFTTSASDSQLLSLSSVVTTTTSNIKYQVILEDLRRLLLQLPKAHYQTLKFLMRHLALIAANGKKTGMDSKNVAIVWAPNLLKPRELELSAGLETLQIIGLQAVITEQLIKHHKFLFDDHDHIESITSTTASVESKDELAQVRKFVDNDNDFDNAHRHLQHSELLHIDQELTTAKETDKQVKEENEENNY